MASDYAVGYIMYNGQALTEVSEVDFEEESNDKPVDTLVRGRSGYSSGAETCKVTLKSAIPRPGYEVNFHTLCRTHQTVQVRFRIAGVERTAEGRIMTAKSSTSVGSASSVDVTIDGKVIAEIAVGIA
jgi:hypothetical protein